VGQRCEQLETEYKNAQIELKSLQNEMKDWLAVKKKLQEEIDKQRMRAEKAEERYQTCAKDLTAASAKCKELEEELKQLRKEVSDLKDELKAEQKKSAALQKKVTEVETALNTVKKALKSKEASLTQSEADIRRLEEELEKLRAQLRSLEDELSEQKKIIDELHTKNMELNDLAELRTHNSGLQDHLNDLMEQLQMLTLQKSDRAMVWEYENLDRSGQWVLYDEECSARIEACMEAKEHKIGMQITQKGRSHPALIHPMNRLHINVDNGMNLKIRRRKITKRYETIAHNDPAN